MDRWTVAGLGLDYGRVDLTRTTQEWLVAGAVLRDSVAARLEGVGCVERIGSSSVLGLLAKPVIDLALGITAGEDLSAVTEVLEAAGWIYRGDAGDAGGHVFVLETRPWHRVAHLHVVALDGEQWTNYLRLRDLLRSSREAREVYESVKLELVDRHAADGRSYTEGKSEVVMSLLAGID